jgi:ribosomal-protein-alanine N-acetyltransferase
MENNRQELLCNKCGKVLRSERGIAYEDYIYIRKDWGYFSQKDGKTQCFLLCESCVEQIARDFAIPASLEDTKELL